MARKAKKTAAEKIADVMNEDVIATSDKTIPSLDTWRWTAPPVDREQFIRTLTIELVKIGYAEPNRVGRASFVPKEAHKLAVDTADILMIGADEEN